MHVNRVKYIHISLRFDLKVAIAAALRCWRNQKCSYVSEVYTEHTPSKMRHLKPVYVTEMDIIFSSVTTKKEITILNFQ